MSTITVRATVTYTYDTDDGLVTNETDAVLDVRDTIDAAQVSSGEFTFEVTTTP